MREVVLRVRDLRKAYKDVVAVDGLDLEVRGGECFGLLGPNGAGKTTTIEICEGLTARDSGDVEVLGLRWETDAGALRQRLGIQLQETQLSDKLTVEETVRLFRSFFRQRPDAGARHRARAARGEAPCARRHAVGRSEAAARARVRARRRPGALVSRRADDGARSAGAPPALGPHRGVQARGPDDPADDALHGRSRAALRASGHHGPRQGHRARVAARARRVDRRRARGGVLRLDGRRSAERLDSRRSCAPSRACATCASTTASCGCR